MAGGRPPFYDSVEEMQKAIDQYFIDCEGEPLENKDGEVMVDKWGVPIMIHVHPPTVTGLALALGFNTRKSLLDYQEKGEFLNTIIRAKARVESYCEERLFDRDGARGAEFSLRNNFRWEEEKTAEEDKGTGVVEIPAVEEVVDQ